MCRPLRAFPLQLNEPRTLRKRATRRSVITCRPFDTWKTSTEASGFARREIPKCSPRARGLALAVRQPAAAAHATGVAVATGLGAFELGVAVAVGWKRYVYAPRPYVATTSVFESPGLGARWT